MPGRQTIVLVPPNGHRVMSVPGGWITVGALALVVGGGFAGYFIPFNRFSLDKVKLNERNNLLRVNQSLDRRVRIVRGLLASLQRQDTLLAAKYHELVRAGEHPAQPRKQVLSKASTMGIGQLYSLVNTMQRSWVDYLKRADSISGYLQGLPVLVPIAGKAIISVPFGPRKDPFTGEVKNHTGVDFVAPRGTPVVVTADGVVTDVRDDLRWGLTVRVGHVQGFSTVYSHLGSVAVKRGARLRKGDIIGTLGATGLTIGPHLHYEVRRHGVPLDPQAFFHPSQDSLVTVVASARETSPRGR